MAKKKPMDGVMDQQHIVIYQNSANDNDWLFGLLDDASFSVSIYLDSNLSSRHSFNKNVVLVLVDNDYSSMIHPEYNDTPCLFIYHNALKDKASIIHKSWNSQLILHVIRKTIAARNNESLLAVSESSRRLKHLAEKVSKTNVSVFLNGNSGVGKEVFARFIHQSSPRKKGPFIAINCAAIPENMLEAMLFGYEKGAFTGASSAHAGKFEQAQGGTLLLDEISEMHLTLQAKLLRVIQESEIERIGGKSLIRLDIRLIATSNRQLKEEVAAGRFREDLFYRLNVFPLHIPELKQRQEDILPLAYYFLELFNNTRAIYSFSKEAENTLLAHTWPGNIRELQNVIQRALVLLDGNEIQASDLHLDQAMGTSVAHISPMTMPENHLHDNLKDREQHLIIDALVQERGSKKGAAERLGISPRTLRYKIARMKASGINVNERIAELTV